MIVEQQKLNDANSDLTDVLSGKESSQEALDQKQKNNVRP
jgi:hypothetical protein